MIKIHKIPKILIAVICLGSYYFYYNYFRGYYDTIVIDDLSKNESHLAEEPSDKMRYNFRWIKIEGELYGETKLKIIDSWTNKFHLEHGKYRDTLILNFRKQGVFDTLIVNNYCDFAIQSEFQNISKPNTKGKLKIKVHLGGFF